MLRFIGLYLGTLVRFMRARRSLLLENLALRQQLAVLKRRHPRPRLDLLDRLFWVAVRRFWSGWQQSLIVVTPETVVRWHRAGFRLYWKLISKVRRPVGRQPTSKEVQELIFRMVVENSTWGARTEKIDDVKRVLHEISLRASPQALTTRSISTQAPSGSAAAAIVVRAGKG
jgi:putative transposase